MGMAVGLTGLNPQPVGSDAPVWWAAQVDSVRIEFNSQDTQLVSKNCLLEVFKNRTDQNGVTLAKLHHQTKI